MHCLDQDFAYSGTNEYMHNDYFGTYGIIRFVGLWTQAKRSILCLENVSENTHYIKAKKKGHEFDQPFWVTYRGRVGILCEGGIWNQLLIQGDHTLKK
jgi:hypothetical protein